MDHSVECACCQSTIVWDKTYPGASTAGWETESERICVCIPDVYKKIPKGSILCDCCFGCSTQESVQWSIPD